MTRALQFLHVLQLQLSPPLPSSFRIMAFWYRLNPGCTEMSIVVVDVFVVTVVTCAFSVWIVGSAAGRASAL